MFGVASLRLMPSTIQILTSIGNIRYGKNSVDKLYEDDRWLLVKPNTYEGSCYYGSSTKWCTASKDYTKHFDDY